MTELKHQPATRAAVRGAIVTRAPNAPMPLERELDGLDVPEHRRLQANRSMRDVEPSVLLKVRDPRSQTIANADDL